MAADFAVDDMPKSLTYKTLCFVSLKPQPVCMYCLSSVLDLNWKASWRWSLLHRASRAAEGLRQVVSQRKSGWEAEGRGPDDAPRHFASSAQGQAGTDPRPELFSPDLVPFLIFTLNPIF